MKKIIKKRFDSLSSFGCCICKHPEPQIHHLVGLKYSGLAQKADDMLTIPLCYEHHLGNDGIHSGVKTWESKHGTQEELLAMVNGFIEPVDSANSFVECI